MGYYKDTLKRDVFVIGERKNFGRRAEPKEKPLS